MRRVILAIKHKLGVQFRYKTQNTKMKKNMLLDGSEKSMIPIIKNNADKLRLGYRKERVISLEEFSAGTGISDLTIFTVDSRLLKERQSSDKQPVTSKNQIQLLIALLDCGSLTLDEIVSRFNLGGKQTVSNNLEQLVRSNLATRDQDTYTASYSISQSTSDNIIAIEAKVRDWKSGIRQAMRYKEYADYSYLAIYENNISSCLANIEIFQKLGIGLIGVSDKGIKIHLNASLSEMTTIENKVLAFERFLSAVDERYETFIAGNGFVTNSTR